jgi:hypothetical protein
MSVGSGGGFAERMNSPGLMPQHPSDALKIPVDSTILLIS